MDDDEPSTLAQRLFEHVSGIQLPACEHNEYVTGCAKEFKTEVDEHVALWKLAHDSMQRKQTLLEKLIAGKDDKIILPSLKIPRYVQNPTLGDDFNLIELTAHAAAELSYRTVCLDLLITRTKSEHAILKTKCTDVEHNFTIEACGWIANASNGHEQRDTLRAVELCSSYVSRTDNYLRTLRIKANRDQLKKLKHDKQVEEEKSKILDDPDDAQTEKFRGIVRQELKLKTKTNSKPAAPTKKKQTKKPQTKPTPPSKATAVACKKCGKKCVSRNALVSHLKQDHPNGSRTKTSPPKNGKKSGKKPGKKPKQ
jgi:hypothetical protein